MNVLRKLLRDESGLILSSELVLVGTLGVIGATVGLKAISTAVNEELEDVSFALRSLDQSYKFAELKGCGAWTAGSSFQQEPVKESLCELDKQIDRDEAAARKRWEELERRFDKDHREMELEPGKKPEKKPEPKKTPPKKKRPGKTSTDEEVVL